LKKETWNTIKLCFDWTLLNFFHISLVIYARSSFIYANFRHYALERQTSKCVYQKFVNLISKRLHLEKTMIFGYALNKSPKIGYLCTCPKLSSRHIKETCFWFGKRMITGLYEPYSHDEYHRNMDVNIDGLSYKIGKE